MHKGEHARLFVYDNFKKGSLRRTLRITKLTSLVCPLCGRHVALSIFNPRSFEPDIFAVSVKGLGRGRGFAVSEAFSVLGDPEITGLIADRCRKILGLIEGKAIPTSTEISALKSELAGMEDHISYWRNETLKLRRARKGDEAELAGMEDHISYWRNETLKLRRAEKEYEAELAGMEDEVSYWRRLATRLKEKVSQLEARIRELEENENEGELLALEEMDEILEKINESADTDFEYLANAVDYLLEEG